MRIVAGRLRGRQFQSPSGHRTHPMSEKIRGAVFNILGDIVGLTVLDAFAGSGALGFEAISRGAAHVTSIDNDKSAHQAVVDSATALGLDNIKITQANVATWSSNNPDETFDIVFCDPPYDAVSVTMVQKLARHVGLQGVMVLSWPSFLETPEMLGMRVLSNKRYGNAQLVFYTRR